MTSLFWLQCGSCGGDTMSLLNVESPDLVDLVELVDSLGIKLLWHPSLSVLSPQAQGKLIENLIEGEQALDILVVEGSNMPALPAPACSTSGASAPRKTWSRRWRHAPAS